MEFDFTGNALTLADLEQAAIEETKESLSDSARDSWSYFGFDRKNEWKAVLTGTRAILVTDEAMDLNMASVFPDTDSFICWLEETSAERREEEEKERLFNEQQQQE